MQIIWLFQAILSSVIEIDYRAGFAFAAAVIAVAGTVPYIVDILRQKTKPHIYTWLIWMLTQGTAAAAVLYGGGGYAGWALLVGVGTVALVFLLSFKYGTKNITRVDTITFLAALTAILVWWQLDNPVMAVLMATAIDGLGYIPTFRKTWENPYSETKLSWLLFFLSGVCTFLSLSEFNLLTMSYLIMINVANGSLWLLLMVKQRN